CGIGRLSTRPSPPYGIEPVASREELLSEPKMSDRRPESLLQLAVPNPINAMTTTRGPRAERRNAHMVTRSHATVASANKHRWGKQAFKSRKVFQYLVD